MTAFRLPSSIEQTPTPDHTDQGETRWARAVITAVEANRPRNQQRTLGPSDAANECDRYIAYVLADTEPQKTEDPYLGAVFGTGFHQYIGEGIIELDTKRRYAVERCVGIDGINGTTDLYDRHQFVVRDWKGSDKAKIARMRQYGMPAHWRVQLSIYAAALAGEGLRVDRITAIAVPRDGRLSDVAAFSEPYEPQVARAALDRIEQIRAMPLAITQPKTSRLCPLCDFYKPCQTPPGA